MLPTCSQNMPQTKLSPADMSQMIDEQTHSQKHKLLTDIDGDKCSQAQISNAATLRLL